MHAVIFDIDGTLLQSAAVDDALYRQSVHAVLGDVDLRPTLHDYEAVTDSGILAQILVDNMIPRYPDPTADVKTHFVELLHRYVTEHGPFAETPGATACLQTLRSSLQHAVAIATGGWGESAALKLESAGLAFADIPLASSNDASDRSEIMAIALSRIGDHFESVTYYGDGPWDMAASKKLGWNFVPVGPDLGGLESLFEVGLT